MEVKTMEFEIKQENGVVTAIGKSAVYHPPIVFNGEQGIKWYEDKPKNKSN